MASLILFATVAALIVFWLTAPRTQPRKRFPWLERATANETSTWTANETEGGLILYEFEGDIGECSYTTNGSAPLNP